MMSEQVTSQISEDDLELDRLLTCIERASTHYEALGVEHSATVDDIKQAYHRAVTLLNLPQPAPGSAVEDASLAPAEIFVKIDQAFDRVSLAFSVLANVSKRDEYDRFMMAKAASPAQASATMDLPDESQFAEPAGGADAIKEGGLAVYVEPSKSVAEDNRRRCQRLELAIPAQITGYDRKNGKWKEIAETIDVSRTGLTLRLNRRIRHGTILHLALPMPMKLRNYDLSEPTYGIYGLVRRVEPVKKGSRVIAIEFIGANPPRGYFDKPWSAFQTKTWAGKDRRRKERKECSELVWLEYFTESMQCIRQESGRVENIGAGGVRVTVKVAPAEFELVRVGYPDRGTETFGVVCSRYFGEDGFERLCLKFVEVIDLKLTDLGMRAIEQGQALNNDESAKSDAGQSAAEIVLQIAGSKSEPHAEPIKTQSQKKQNRRAKILVADDDLPLRKVLGKILETAGYDVILVEDGQAAVEKAKYERPDLVITDGLMPKMHGFLVCQSIKEMPSPPPVIMLTAVYTKMQYRWEAKTKYGADELLTKPFEVAELLGCIEKHLALSQRPEAMPA